MPQRDVKEVILDSIADGVFTVDRNWNITSFNRAAERITGVSRNQAIGQKCFDVFRADICQLDCALRATVETGQEQLSRRVNILNADGIPVPISISTAVLSDEKGEVIGGVECFRDLSAIEMLRKRIRGEHSQFDIVSKNHRIQSILDILPNIAISQSTVLIEGPSGSGKELFAKAIHVLSERDGKYVVLNCAALPDALLESELFGYVKGAFTDARADKPGRFALAEGGTLFLDEIGDISPMLQMKLLRVLQEREYEPLGSVKTIKADVRIVAATNKNLAELAAQGTFREDLFYRLNVARIVLPPLADRREDVPILADHFISKFNAEKGKEIERLSEDALNVLMQHDFPGNVRELENSLEYAFILCNGSTIEREHLPVDLLKAQPDVEIGKSASTETPLVRVEAEAIREVLERYGGNRRKAADHLGIHKTTLWRKMKKYGITPSHSE